MKSIVINLIGVKVRLCSNTEDAIAFIIGFNHILDIFYQLEQDESVYDCTLFYYDEPSTEQKIILDGDNAIFIAEWRKVFRSTSIRTIIILLAERYRQQYFNQLTLHASSFASNGKGVICLGSQGAGKTAIMMQMVIRDAFEYISNEYTVVGMTKNGISLFGASGPLSIRYESLKMSFPELINNIFKEKPTDAWQNKKRISPEQLGMKIAQTPLLLKNVYVLRLQKSGENYMEKIDDLYRLNALLYEESTRIIKGCALPIYTPEGKVSTYCPSFDTPFANLKRQHIFESLTNKVSMLSGTMDFCRETIKKDLYENDDK